MIRSKPYFRGDIVIADAMHLKSHAINAYADKVAAWAVFAYLRWE